MWSLILKDDTDELIYKTGRDTDFESKFMVPTGKCGGSGAGVGG